MSWILEKINSELREHYAEAGLSQDTSIQVGWKDRRAQYRRFTQIAQVISEPKGDFSINDLGCGLGDLFVYLQESGYNGCHYYGYDMLDDMIEKAKVLHAKAPKCEFISISKSSDMRLSDYVVASGIFNLKYTILEHEWLYYILDTISCMNSKSRLGFSFNILSIYSDVDRRKDNLYYGDPLFMFDYCKRNYSKNVALLHDYNEYDFTIVVRK